MADVVVIGAGIIGSSVALHLARAGASVVIVDAGLPGRATTAGAGIISPLGLTPSDEDADWTRIVEAATSEYARMFEELGEGAAEAGEYRVVGELVAARDDEEASRLDSLAQRVHDRFEARGVRDAQVERMTGASLRELWPAIDDRLEALYVSGTARVDGNKLSALLLDRAQQHGARLLRARAELGEAHGRPTLTVDGETIAAGSIVIAAGSWAGPMLRTAGVRMEVAPDRGQIIHLDAPYLATHRLPVLKTFPGPYLLGFAAGRVVVGATHQWTASFDSEIRAGDQLTVLRDALGVAPGLSGARIAETRVGLRPAAADGLPLIGPSALDRVYVAAGLGSWGLTLGPLLGEVLAHDILQDGRGAWDIGFLDPLRSVEPTVEDAPGLVQGEIR